MSYRLCKLPFGTSKIETKLDLDTDLIITGFINIEKFGFLFLFRSNHFIGYANSSGKLEIPWMGQVDIRGNNDGSNPLLNSPSSICYCSSNNACYLLEEGGRCLRKIDISFKYANHVWGNSNDTKIQELFKKIVDIDKTETYCDVDSYGNFYWSVKDLHKCLIMDNEYGEIKNYIGNGHSCFGTSDKLDACSLSRPCGIKYISGSLYIADSGNHCIRKTDGKSLNIVYGHPMNGCLHNPTYIKNHKNVIYIQDENKIYYFSLIDKNNGLLYESPNLMFIDTDQRDLLILEKT